MNTLTNFKIALIAGAASIFTTATHGGFQAVYLKNTSGIDILAFMLGRVLGDLPTALLCVGSVYGLLYLRAKKNR